MFSIILLSRLFAQSLSCSPKNEVCFTPTINKTTVNIAMKFKPLKSQYIAIGFGSKEGMAGAEIISFTKTTKYMVTSYYASDNARPTIIPDKWQISNVVETPSQVTLMVSRSVAATGGKSKLFPSDGGTFIWSTGTSAHGELTEHQPGNNGQITVKMTPETGVKYKAASSHFLFNPFFLVVFLF